MTGACSNNLHRPPNQPVHRAAGRWAGRRPSAKARADAVTAVQCACTVKPQRQAALPQAGSPRMTAVCPAGAFGRNFLESGATFFSAHVSSPSSPSFPVPVRVCARVRKWSPYKERSLLYRLCEARWAPGRLGRAPGEGANRTEEKTGQAADRAGCHGRRIRRNPIALENQLCCKAP